MVALAVGLILSNAYWWRSNRPVPQPLIRLSVDLGPEARDADSFSGRLEAGNFALSPDGSRLLYPVRGPDGQRRLAVRSFDNAQVTPLMGTEGGSNPFFSPDGQWIAFFAGGKLVKIPSQGGSPIVILSDAADPRGGSWGSWGEDGDIILATPNKPLFRVSSNGGVPHPATKLAPNTEEAFPQALPDAVGVLFTTLNRAVGEQPSIDVQIWKTGQRKTLVQGASYGRYSPSGHLLYVKQGAFFAAPMNLKRLEITGPEVPVLGNIAVDPIYGGSEFAFAGAPSGPGIFVGLLGTSTQARRALLWLDSSGKPQPVAAADPAIYQRLRLSPDGKRLALTISDGSNGSIWIRDLQAERTSRLTSKGSADSPHGRPMASMRLIMRWCREARTVCIGRARMEPAKPCS